MFGAWAGKTQITGRWNSSGSSGITLSPLLSLSISLLSSHDFSTWKPQDRQIPYMIAEVSQNKCLRGNWKSHNIAPILLY